MDRWSKWTFRYMSNLGQGKQMTKIDSQQPISENARCQAKETQTCMKVVSSSPCTIYGPCLVPFGTIAVVSRCLCLALSTAFTLYHLAPLPQFLGALALHIFYHDLPPFILSLPQTISYFHFCQLHMLPLFFVDSSLGFLPIFSFHFCKGCICFLF